MNQYLVIYSEDDGYNYCIYIREDPPAHSWLQPHVWDLPEACTIVAVAQLRGDVSSVMVA